MNSPAKIVKLWAKIKANYEGKKPDLIESGAKQKTGIKKGLTQLKERAAAATASPEGRQAFLDARDTTAQAMGKYFRFLTTSKDEDNSKLPMLKKKLKSLTVVVKQLDADNLDLTEGEASDADFNQLDQVDTKSFDALLQAPDVEEGKQPQPVEDTTQPTVDQTVTTETKPQRGAPRGNFLGSRPVAKPTPTVTPTKPVVDTTQPTVDQTVTTGTKPQRGAPRGNFLGPRGGATTTATAVPTSSTQQPTPLANPTIAPSSNAAAVELQLSQDLTDAEGKLKTIQTSLRTNEKLLADRETHLASLKAQIEYARSQGREDPFNPTSDKREQLKAVFAQVKAQQLVVQDDQQKLLAAQQVVATATTALEQQMDPLKLAFQKKLKAISPLLERAKKVPDPVAKTLDTKLQQYIADAPTDYAKASRNLDGLERLARNLSAPDKVKDRHQNARLQNAACARNTGAALELSQRLLNADGSLNVASLDQQLLAYNPPPVQPGSGWAASKVPSAGPPALPRSAPHTKRLVKTLQLLKSDPQLAAKIQGIGKPDPANPATAMIRSTLGLDPEAEVSAAQAQQAVLSSLLAELRQEDVGSCFGTSVSIKIHDHDPGRFLGDMQELINTGYLTRTLPDNTTVKIPASAAMSTASLEKKVRLDSDGKMVGAAMNLADAPGTAAALDALGVDPAQRAKAVKDALALIQNRPSVQEATQKAAGQAALKELPATAQANVKQQVEGELKRVSQDTKQKLIAKDAAAVSALTQTLQNSGLSAQDATKVVEKYQATLQAPEVSTQEILQQIVMTRRGLTDTDLENYNRLQKLRPRVQAIMHEPQSAANHKFLDEVAALDKQVSPKMNDIAALERELQPAQNAYLAQQDNRLLRSWEYTVSSLAEKGASCTKKAKTQTATTQAIRDQLRDIREEMLKGKGAKDYGKALQLLSPIENKLTQKFEELFAANVQFGYNADQRGTLADDGSSDRGGWCMYDTTGAKDESQWIKVADRGSYSKLIEGLMLQACDEVYGNEKNVGRAMAEKVAAAANQASFLNRATEKIKDQYDDKAKKKVQEPWGHPSGGFEQPLMEAYYEKSPLTAVAKQAANGEELCGWLLKEVKPIRDQLQTSQNPQVDLEDAMLPMSGGSHAFLLKPGHPSLKDALAAPDPAAWVSNHAQEKKVEAQAIRTTEATAALVEKLCGNLINDAEFLQKITTKLQTKPNATVADVIPLLEQAIDEKYPDKDQEASRKYYKENKLPAVVAQTVLPPVAKKDLPALLGRALGRLKPAVPANTVDLTAVAGQLPDGASMAQIEKALAAALPPDPQNAKKVTEALGAELPKPPGLVIADTNWGGGDHQTVFTMMTNPLNGEMELWSVNEDGSELSKKDSKDWITEGPWTVYTKPDEVGGV